MFRAKSLLSLITGLITFATAQADFALVGYLPEYRVAKITPKQVQGVTDIIYFSLKPEADGKLASNVIKPDVLKKLQTLQSATKCKLLICVGGWGRSEHFPALAANPASRKRLISQMLAYCLKNGFDGIDYDWEHPKNEKQIAGYQNLLVETSAAFHAKKLRVTVAQASWQNIGKKSYQAIDRIHLMSYDHAFPQSTLAKSQADVGSLIKWGCPPQKIALGVPFYGRNKLRQSRTYAQLVDGSKLKPDTDIIDGFAFNGKATLSKKINLAKTHQLAGLMVWELGQDSPDKNKSLLQQIQSQR